MWKDIVIGVLAACLLLMGISNMYLVSRITKVQTEATTAVRSAYESERIKDVLKRFAPVDIALIQTAVDSFVNIKQDSIPPDEIVERLLKLKMP